ncbi:hypothetical protein [Tumebacillus permanentifrigoris]|uniref:hypothetical protein n=1 Tax=Tumebacillus permanentifrigoris TaxID=378543 RepID=UPI000D6CF5F2|nr:hypothetical protein [Tumebacillus permanentifrigoris]
MERSATHRLAALVVAIVCADTAAFQTYIYWPYAGKSWLLPTVSILTGLAVITILLLTLADQRLVGAKECAPSWAHSFFAGS